MVNAVLFKFGLLHRCVQRTWIKLDHRTSYTRFRPSDSPLSAGTEVYNWSQVLNKGWSWIGALACSIGWSRDEV
ncbi:hypothetical protein LENED_004520 [Lentinula edodes]|uniref:Uncharacterized protein n=1 Tax=Lentinula edodes TaxID=5353 RepID=A0A1Q3E6X2_LENED|nr:hypothetical protein LENED_004520 [Lentinula edodes]